MLFLGMGIAFSCLKAQPSFTNVNIQLLGPEQGLPDRTVRCIAQDSAGFLWIGTAAALWRYDGYTFQNYTYLITGKSDTLNLIDDIVLSPDKMLWIAHGNGLSIVNPVTLASKAVDVGKLPPAKLTTTQVSRIYFDQDGDAWLSMLGNVLVKLSVKAKFILMLKTPKRQSDEITAKRAVFQFLPDHEGKLYLFSIDNYLDVIDKKGHYLRGIELRDKTVPKDFFAAYINTSPGQNLVIYYKKPGSTGRLIREYSFRKQAFVPVTVNADSVYPGTAFRDPNGNVWYKSENELGFLNTGTQKFIDVTTQIQQKVGTETYFFNACNGSDNTFWLCSSAGLFKITISEPLFRTYLSIPLQKPTDIGTSMRGITEDSTGQLWLCSYGFKSGVNTFLVHKLDPHTGVIQHQRVLLEKDTARTASGLANIFYKILFSKQKMYATTDGTTLLELKASGNTLKGKGYYNVSVNELTTIYALNDSILWLGSLSGMIQVNIKTERSVLLNSQPGNFIRNFRINYFMPWHAGSVLASTSNGLYELDSNAAIIDHYGNDKKDKIHLPVQSVLYTIYCMQNLWAATPNGLLRIDTASKKTVLYTMQDGLPDNNVYTCLPDNQGNLWLSTNNGLCRFNIKTKQVHNYGLADGLPHMEFNSASFLKARDGTFYFGGLNGIVSFDPAHLTVTKEVQTPLQLISYSKYGADNRLETVPADQVQNPIVFSSGDRLFSFSFMAPDFRHTELNRFRYQLEGWTDQNWHLFETGNRLSFNSLPPGTYTLRVQVSVAGADWSRNIWHATIKVRAPWYKTTWFFGLALVTVALIFYAFYRYRLSQVIHIYEIRNRISADMHDEIGSTLSSITFYSQALLMQQQDEKQKVVLQKIKDNAQQVQEGLSDIIWSVKASMDEIENVFARMFQFGTELLETKDISFHFEREESLRHDSLAMTERKNFYLIFKEAVNNAAKYSECKNIWVRIKQEKHFIKMTVEDDGKGFDPVSAKRGNGLSNMQQRAEQMNGTITVQSAFGQGTSITLLF